jgi:cytochrome c2
MMSGQAKPPSGNARCDTPPRRGRTIKIGTSLLGVVDRKAASLDDYAYSEGIKDKRERDDIIAYLETLK